jgi:hypothetical protein
LIGGTTEPVRGATWPRGPSAAGRAIAAARRVQLDEGQGARGWFADGRTAVPMQPGAASLVIRRNGTVDVGA